MFENKPVKLTLESGDVKLTSEMNWDAPMDDLLNSFYGLCIGATWHPTSVLETMAEFASEKLESLKPKECREECHKELSVDDSIKGKIKLRQEANREILAILSEFIEKYPDIRFGQALATIGIIQYDKGEAKDPFGEESIDMLKRLNCKS